MMAFDKNKDGKLTKEEVTDERLHRLFDQADANKDGVVTKEELMALAAKLDEESRRRAAAAAAAARRAGRPRRRGPGGPGGRGRFGPPQPGQILPPFLQEQLKLTADQKKQLDALQKEVDAKLDKILTDRSEEATQGDARPRAGRPRRAGWAWRAGRTGRPGGPRRARRPAAREGVSRCEEMTRRAARREPAGGMRHRRAHAAPLAPRSFTGSGAGRNGPNRSFPATRRTAQRGGRPELGSPSPWCRQQPPQSRRAAYLLG